MKKGILYAGGILAAFFTVLAFLTLISEHQAKDIRDSVLRFHIVANSDSSGDQHNKMCVRDGIAELCSQLFENVPDKASAMQSAVQNSDMLSAKAEDILRTQGCGDSVSVTVGKRFFPTRTYDGISLPAGIYDTVDVSIGAAKGHNFWCVMFPDICVGASSKQTNSDKMSDVLSDGALEMVTETSKPTVKLRFKLVEIYENIRHYICTR